MTITPDSPNPENSTSPPPLDSQLPGAGSDSADALPEYEPLTPELVEDEAVRGDFVIRWAVILLASLLSWTQIEDTSLLVRIRSAAVRWLPFGADTFSCSAADRSWKDLGWLSNPILALAHQILGPTGLTLLGVACGAITFWALSRISLRGVSTWWGSVCGALALVAVFPHLTPGPVGVTLLGTALLLLQLYRWSEDSTGQWSWKLPVTLWVWSQLDPGAWVGAAILLLFTMSWVGLRGPDAGEAPDRSRRLWQMTGAGVLAWLIHPLHYHVLLSPWSMLRVETAELREYRFSDLGFRWEWYSVLTPEFRQYADVFAYSAVAIAVLALLSLLLNFRRLTWEWLIPWVGLLGLTCVSAQLLPVTALVSAVIATLNAQSWYRATCSQAYTVDTMPLLWNRGGRAITVVGLLLLGLIANNGMLMGKDGRRIGSGFSPRMAANIAGAEKLAKEVSGQEIFNFRIEQGDLLIWAGLKPYVDRRLSLYTQGSENLLVKHRLLRKALLPSNSTDPEAGRREFWTAEFDKLHVNQAIPRLSEPNPDYGTMVQLMSEGWVLSNLESFGAVLSRSKSPDANFQKHLQEHPGINFVIDTFRTDPGKDSNMNLPWLFPRRPTVYDTWLWQPQTLIGESAQLAGHEEELFHRMAAANPGNPAALRATTALALSAFRHARAALVTQPQSVQAYRVMARAAQYLSQLEGSISQSTGASHSADFWLYHALHAYHHALQLDPNSAQDHEALALFQLNRGKLDLARDHFQEVYRLLGRYTALPKEIPDYDKFIKERDKLVQELKLHVRQSEDAVLKVPANGRPWEEGVQTAMSRQCPGFALRVLEENRTKVAQDVSYQVLQIGILMDVGRTEDALSQASALVSRIPQSRSEADQPMSSEVRMLQTFASLAVGDNVQTEKSLETESRYTMERSVQELLLQSPLAAGVSLQLDLQASSQALVAFQSALRSTQRWASLQLMLAQSEMSTGRNSSAKERLLNLLRTEPDCMNRPLVAYYLELLTGEEVDPFSPAMREAMQRAAETAPPQPAGPAESGSSSPTQSTPSQTDAGSTAPPDPKTEAAAPTSNSDGTGPGEKKPEVPSTPPTEAPKSP